LCAQAFRVWLQARYGTLDEVNRCWNTTFWGHTYTNWEQIETPTTDGERSMQTLLIDYNRFASDALLNCCRDEAKILREITPDVPITTNMMGAFKPLDYHRWARELDIVSWDSYPGKDAPPAQMAFNHALMRGLKENQSWMLMEQTPSQQNWQAHNALKRPGVMRLWSYQAMAHGADTVMYFQWRRSRGAQEKYHGAVVEHVGHENTRVFGEVAQLGRELENLGTQTLGKKVQSDVAVLFDWDNWWAIEYSSGPSVDLKYVQQCQHFYGALHQNGISADILSPGADLSAYKVIVAPVLYMVKPGVAQKLENFVRNGGQLVTTFFSGLVDENDLVYLGGYPGPLRALLGIWGEEIDALAPTQKNRAVFESPFGSLHGDYSCGLLCDIVHLESAQSLATYGDDFYAGTPCVTMNQFGNGRAYYVATHLEQKALNGLLQEVCAQAGVTPLISPQNGVEATRRADESGEQLYLLNHNAAEVQVCLPDGAFRDLLSGETVSGSLKLAPYGVSILSNLQ
jgi:beta-galactosidase